MTQMGAQVISPEIIIWARVLQLDHVRLQSWNIVTGKTETCEMVQSFLTENFQQPSFKSLSFSCL